MIADTAACMKHIEEAHKAMGVRAVLSDGQQRQLLARVAHAPH